MNVNHVRGIDANVTAQHRAQKKIHFVTESNHSKKIPLHLIMWSMPIVFHLVFMAPQAINRERGKERKKFRFSFNRFRIKRDVRTCLEVRFMMQSHKKFHCKENNQLCVCGGKPEMST